jgi:hypothetical protein
MTDDSLKTETIHDKEEKTLSLLNQILSYKGLIIGIAAVLTALASWFKPADITATKATYEVLSVRVNELSKTTSDLTKSVEDCHNETTSLKAYIQGFNNGRASDVPNSTPSVPVSKAQKPKVKIAEFADIAPPVVALEQTKQVELPKPPPPVASPPLPPFEKVIK